MTDDTTLDELRDLSTATWQHMSARDVEALDAVFHAHAVFVHMGATLSKEQELDVIRSGRIHYRDIDVHDVVVHVTGDTAVVLTDLTMTAVVEGQEVTNPFVTTQTWIRDRERWWLTALAFTRRIDRAA